jgi:L-asparaginase
MKQRIHLIITGGTIDASYSPPHQTAKPNAVSVIPDYIDNVIKPHFAATFEILCMKDSREITDALRRKMIAAVKKTTVDHIIITHGTDTLAQTAEFLNRHLAGTEKTILLVGAMVPLKDMVQSDAGFNLGFAAGSFAALSPGVYICMNGGVFMPGDVKKNAKKARFE